MFKIKPKKYIKKITCCFLVCLMMFLTCQTGLASTIDKDIKPQIRKVGDLTEQFTKTINEKGETIITSCIVNEKTNDETFIEIKENKTKRIIKVFVNEKLDHKVTRLNNSNKMIFEKPNGEKEILNAEQFVKEVPNEKCSTNKDTNLVALSSSPSYPFLEKEWSSAFEVWGYLYGEDNVDYSTTYVLQFSAGTAVGTILGALPAVYGYNISGIIVALGSAIIGSVIDTAINGNTYTRTERWDYEVWCQQKLGLKTYTEDIDAKTIDNDTGNVEWVDLTELGDTRSRSDMIHAGIYNVMVIF